MRQTPAVVLRAPGNPIVSRVAFDGVLRPFSGLSSFLNHQLSAQWGMFAYDFQKQSPASGGSFTLPPTAEGIVELREDSASDVRLHRLGEAQLRPDESLIQELHGFGLAHHARHAHFGDHHLPRPVEHLLFPERQRFHALLDQ